MMKDKEAFVLINQMIGICLTYRSKGINKKLIELGEWSKKPNKRGRS